MRIDIGPFLLLIPVGIGAIMDKIRAYNDSRIVRPARLIDKEA